MEKLLLQILWKVFTDSLGMFSVDGKVHEMMSRKKNKGLNAMYFQVA